MKLLYNFLTIKSTGVVVFHMSILKFCIIAITLFTLSSNDLAIEKAERISDREIIESLAELKAGQKGLEGRIIGLES